MNEIDLWYLNQRNWEPSKDQRAGMWSELLHFLAASVTHTTPNRENGKGRE